MTPEEQAAADAAAAEEVAKDAEVEADAAEEEKDNSQSFNLKYVQQLRSEAAKYRREAREAQAKAKEFEDAKKTETELAVEKAAVAVTAAELATNEASRLRVALDKGLTADQAKRLVGDSEEEMSADADSLIELFSSTDDGQDLSSGTPRERLKPGAVPSAESEETDPAKLADMVPRAYQ